MKKILFLWLFLLTIVSAVHAQQPIVVQDSIVGNVTWTNDKTYLIRGFLYIVNGASLTIQPGTLIFGEKSTKGTLIVEPGGKLWATGTATQPIVFTSAQAAGSRDRGDWGGIVLCGRAPINQNNTLNGGTVAGGDAQIEGGPRTHYGGTDEHDNSGALSYVRVEFPGIALAPNNEINGVTFGGVGDGTQIDHVQVSYSGDDNYEWFGGSVNAKYLIGFRGLDDEWDTDFGWHGKLQFCVSLRDPNVADVSTSNGFESDNDAAGDDWNPHTSATISNLTVVGPMADTSLSGSINPLFGRGAHLRRSTRESIYNSIVMGWKDGLLIDGTITANNCTIDSLQIRNCIWAGLRPGHDFLKASAPATFDPVAWFKTSNYNNQAIVQPWQVLLGNPFSLTAPDFVPIANSPAIGAASFNNWRLKDPFFTPVTYAGAFQPLATRWDTGWVNYDPQNTNYVAVATSIASTINFPSVAVGAHTDTTVVIIRNTGNGPAMVTSWKISDTTNFKVVGTVPSSFNLPVGGSQTMTLRFVATDTNAALQNIVFNFDVLPQATILLAGKGKSAVVPAPGISIYPSATKFDFALVRVGDSATGSIIVTNTGTADLQISGSSITGTDASQFKLVNSGNITVAPTKTGTVFVRFKPTSIGAKTATLTITHNAGAATVITLTGMGINVPGQDVLQDSIVGNITLTNDRTWLVKGFVYVVNGSTLTIEAGTVLFGEKATKGTIIVEPGAKIYAVGTPEHPIVFTSQLPAGQRDRGDWGGIVLCGRAPINQNNTLNGGAFAGGDAQIEGGPRTHYGGTNEHDNSGIMRYCRIEFPGVALSPNNEINGLTMGGVGDSTQIDHVQVSYSGDDNYEWFGGSVCAKYLIGLRGLDDEWDTDFGWHGKLQFCVSLRDPNIADVSGSNGFESDNDASGHDWNPHTSARISNLTVVGPMSDTSKSSAINPLFKRGAHLRRTTHESIYNTIDMGFPDGILIDGDLTAQACLKDSLQIRNCIWAGLRPGHDFLKASVVVSFDPATWYKTPSYNNQALVQPADVKLVNPFNLTAPDFRPMTGSPAINAADFTTSALNDPFFTKVSYIGAFDPNGTRWDSGWANYDPQNTDYTAKRTFSKNAIDFGKIKIGQTATDSIVITNTGLVPITVTGMSVTGGSEFQLVGGTGGFTVGQGASKTLYVTFMPTSIGMKNGNIHLTMRDETSADIALSAEGVSASSVRMSESQALIGLRNSPNPFSNVTMIEYNVSQTSQVTIEVVDVTGRVVSHVVSELQTVGSHSQMLNAEMLASGVYYVRLTTGDAIATKPIVISH